MNTYDMIYTLLWTDESPLIIVVINNIDVREKLPEHEIQDVSSKAQRRVEHR